MFIHPNLHHQPTGALMNFKLHVHGVAIAMIVTGLLYPSFSDISIASVIASWFGQTGFFVFCLVMIFMGFMLIALPDWMGLWLSPLYVVWIATIPMAFQGTHTAIVFYSTIVVFPLYLHYRQTIQFQRLTARRLFIPIFISMSVILVLNPNSQGLQSIYNIIGVWTLGLVSPVLVYETIYIASVIILCTQEFTGLLRDDRLATQVVILPFVLHGLIFSYVIFSNTGIYSLVPFLLMPPLLFLAVSREYDYD